MLRLSVTWAQWLVLCIFSLTFVVHHSTKPTHNHIWVVEIVGGNSVADKVATDNGFINLGPVKALKNKYKFQLKTQRRPRRSLDYYHKNIATDKRVTWAQHQKELRRSRRDFQDIDEYNDSELPNKVLHKAMISDNRKKTVHLNDEYWPMQWYLHGSRGNHSSEPDLQVISAWNMGYTGKGVVVTVIDDGLEHTHIDLQKNYDADASYDINDDDSDPFPRYAQDEPNKHGTRCAGEIAMEANNSICGVGIAFNAKIGGIRILDGKVTDLIEAESLSFNLDYIDIFSASWGPNDDGKSMEKPGPLASEALKAGIQKGRGGRGTIYVWASGNGGGRGDNCACDGYASSVYTLSVSSVTQGRISPWYSEHCSSIMATTYSSGRRNEARIVATDLHNGCTAQHTGTSASAPLAAGVFALALEANPKLTWRDMQHLTAWTSDYSGLRYNPGWTRNGAGYWVNSRFGFGLLNAASLVKSAIADSWKTVPKQVVCTQSIIQSGRETILSAGKVTALRIISSGCRGELNEINHLEHVQVSIDAEYSVRGDLQIVMESPAGTITTLLPPRKHDRCRNGLKNWPFMSVHQWGENPAGEWSVTFTDDTRVTTTVSEHNKGKVHNVTLILYGTRKMPAYMKLSRGKRNYK